MPTLGKTIHKYIHQFLKLVLVSHIQHKVVDTEPPATYGAYMRNQGGRRDSFSPDPGQGRGSSR